MGSAGVTGDWRREALCRRAPEWWVGAERGAQFRRRVARHICLEHCPVFDQCAEDVAANPNYVAGTVSAGVYYVGGPEAPRPYRNQPMPSPIGCPHCPPLPRPAPGERNVSIEEYLPLVKSMRAAGMTYKRIAEELGCSSEGVRNACDRHGIKRGPARVAA